MRVWRSWAGTAFVAALAIGLASCGGGHIPVALESTGATLEGEVKYGDKTLEYGIVIVEGAGSSAQGQISDDGTYRVENVPVGPVKLAVVTNPGMARAAQMAGSTNQGPGAKGKGKLGKAPEFVDVPAKFHSTATANLSYTVQKGTNKHTIVLPK